MARVRRLVVWVGMALAVPATVAFSPVHPATPAQPARWDPQMVVAVHQVDLTPSAGVAATAHRGTAAGAFAVRSALTRLGDPYVWAAAGPHAFDCSGLVVWSFEQAGVQLPHSSQALAAGGQPVPLEQIQVGDVITYYSDASHVGLYVGNGKMVHASTYGVPVGVAPVDNAPIYNVRRYR